jgi:hypothetical protein
VTAAEIAGALRAEHGESWTHDSKKRAERFRALVEDVAAVVAGAGFVIDLDTERHEGSRYTGSLILACPDACEVLSFALSTKLLRLSASDGEALAPVYLGHPGTVIEALAREVSSFMSTNLTP